MAKLVISVGDPAGIGPEVVLKALGTMTSQERDRITLVGDHSCLMSLYNRFGDRAKLANPEHLSIIDVPMDHPTELGQPHITGGAASFKWLNEAITRTLAGEFNAIVTAPIAKIWWQRAGHDWPGQTEVLASRAQSKDFGMMFVGRSPHTGWPLRCLLATTHVPLRSVPELLTPTLMSQKLKLLIETLHTHFKLDYPTIAIAGLNPHSGEGGKLGTEERDWLEPWLKQQQQQYPQVKLMGLFPPDTMWVGAGQAWFLDGNLNPADAYLALYHDQGLIPVKLMGFDYAVNTTIGLPFIRTSPDHGTAFDIADRGIANPTSMIEAITLAQELTGA
jgi:4-hydroxythreonine-4-phosphate dehydrogenase